MFVHRSYIWSYAADKEEEENSSSESSESSSEEEEDEENFEHFIAGESPVESRPAWETATVGVEDSAARYSV